MQASTSDNAKGRQVMENSRPRFGYGDIVYIKGRKGHWIVRDADERFDNAMMLVYEQDASGFVLLAVRGSDCYMVKENV